jgi:hypothetical protein
MSVYLWNGRDEQGLNVDAPKMPTDIYTATLAAASASSITIPSNFQNWVMYVRVQPNGWVWISNGNTAAVPGGGSLTAATSELIVGTLEYRRVVQAGDVISFITANTTCDICVSLFCVTNL